MVTGTQERTGSDELSLSAGVSGSGGAMFAKVRCSLMAEISAKWPSSLFSVWILVIVGHPETGLSMEKKDEEDDLAK